MIRFLGVITKLNDICLSCLPQFSSSSSYSPLKIILKQLFTSGSVNTLNIYLVLDFASVNSGGGGGEGPGQGV